MQIMPACKILDDGREGAEGTGFCHHHVCSAAPSTTTPAKARKDTRSAENAKNASLIPSVLMDN